MELTVPFVQELAKEALTKVPDRYIRSHQDRPILSSSSATTPLPQLPVIDLSKLLSHDLNQPELKKLHYACKEWGFFQLINHGVSGSLVENVKKGAEEFFNLPMEEKKKFEQREGDVQGYGQAFVVSEEQKLDWADMFFLFTLPSHIRKPHLFPNIPLPFRVDLETYCEELRTLAIQILDLMAYSLAIDPAEIRELFDHATQSTRMNYYPPCPQPELVVGLNSHSDGGGLTILLQGNDVEGLQIKKDGLWIPVKPLPNAFIVNLGDMLEMATNGAEEFFNLPMEEKKKFEQREGDVQGYGQAFVVSEEQKLDWADMFFLFTLPSHIRKPHLFPNIPLPFRVDLETYCEELRTLAIQILDLMAYSLAIDPAEIRELFDHATQSTRMNYYPPCPQPELVVGLNSHSDGGGLTILLQGNDVEGLQIKKDGLWIPVKPLPNAFIVNLGDMLEMATNGIYRSIEHRAMVNSEKERFSIATFYSPALNTIMNPAPSLVTPNTPAVFKRISAGEYFKGYLAQELRGKSFLNSIRVEAENDQKPSEIYD